MQMTKTTFLVILITVLLHRIGLAQVDKGWEQLKNNNRKVAKEHFLNAAKNNPDDTDALLSLAYINWISGVTEESFQYVEQFYKKHPNPTPYIYALWATDFCQLYRADSKSKVAFLKKVAEDPKIDGTLKAMSNYALGLYYEEKKKYSDADKYFDKIGYLSAWQIAGEFDNVSGSGFDKEYEPITKSKSSDTFINKNGAKIGWITPKYFRTAWIDFTYLSDDTYHSQYYAQTFVNSPIDQDVYMNVGVSGAIKLWLNDAYIDGISEERNTDFDVYNYPVHLNKGYNRILVQLGVSEIRNANFCVRIVDDKSNPIGALESEAAYQAYTPAPVYQKKSSKLYVEKFFEGELKTKPNSLLYHFLASAAYAHNGKIKETINVLRNAVKIAPNNTTAHQLLMTYLNINRNAEEASKEQNFIVENDPENMFSLQTKFNEEVQKEDYDAADAVADKMINLFGKQELTYQYKIRSLALKQKNEELYHLINEAYSKFPNEYVFVNLRVLMEQGLNNSYLAQRVLERYLGDNTNEDATAQLYKIYTQTNNSLAGINLYKELTRNYPYAVGYYDHLSGIYFEAHNYEKALEYIKSVNQILPYSGKTWYSMALIYEAMNKKEEAKDALKKAIYYSPTNYDARKKLRKLEGQKDIASYFSQPDVYSIVKKAPATDAFKDHNAAILLHEVQNIIYPEGGSESRNIVVIKVLNNAGVEDWKTYNVGFNRNNQRVIVEKAEIVKTNGNKIKADDNNYEFVFSGLEPGDCIYLNYRTENYGRGKLANHFWETFQLNYFLPCNKAKYTLLVPTNKAFKYEVVNGNTKPTINKIDEFTAYNWTSTDTKPIVSERLMPDDSDVLEMLHISSIPDWKFVADWYADLSSIKAKSEPEVIEAVKVALKGREKGTETQKAQAIYEYIVNNIVYSSIPFRQGAYVPQRASTTLNAKLGDCKDVSTLFVAMAKEAGLKANLVLVDTHDNGEKDIVLPSINFNHCIAKVNADGKEHYLELTWKDLPFASSTYDLKNALTLNINTDTKLNNDVQLKKLQQTSKPNYCTRKTEITVEGNNISVTNKNLKTGYNAAGIRNSYRNLPKEDQEKRANSSISNNYKGQVKLQSIAFGNLDNLKDTVTYDYKFQVKNAVSNVGNLKILPLSWVDGEHNVDFINDDERKFDLNYYGHNYVDVEKEEIIITLEKGKTFSEIPTNKTIAFEDYFEYRTTYNANANILTATREFKLKKGVIPKEKYEKFKEVFSQIVDEDTKQLGFK